MLRYMLLKDESVEGEGEEKKGGCLDIYVAT